MSMPDRVGVWLDPRPDAGDVVYVSAEEVTERQARLLEAALCGDVSIDEMLSRWES